MKIKKLVSSCLFFFAVPLVMLAQSKQEYDTRYQNAKILLQNQKYEMAMQEFLPLTNPYPENEHAAEASYFYALSALKSNRLTEAYNMLRQIEDQHENWANIAEARFLLANVHFERKDYEKALEILNTLRKPELKAEAAAMKKVYLPRIEDKLQFQYLLQTFPNDRELAQVYADKLSQGWYQTEDKQALENLVRQFNLDREKYLNAMTSVKKDTYQVAVLFPFQVDKNLQYGPKVSQFVADLYAGILIARDSLQKAGKPVKLFTYDTSSDTNQVKQILDLPEIKTMDLLIGPIYKSSSRIVSRFAKENNINIINPLTQDIELAENNPNLFLFESSVVTQAKKAAEFAYNNFEVKSGIIVYDNTRDDTLFAQVYKKHYEELGGKILLFKKISFRNNTNVTAAISSIELKDAGHMLVASNTMSAAVNTISLLESKQSEIPLITFSGWLEVSQLSMQQLDARDIYFIHPKYINNTAAHVKRFKKQYIKRFNLPPSEYAYSGYEMLFYFGNLMHKYGNRFNASLTSESFTPGVFYKGYQYSSPQGAQPYQNDNQYFPITKLEDLQLQVVNPPAAVTPPVNKKF